MSGLEALGATASVLQLAELCAKCSRKTAQIVRSYRDAPKEIKQLAMKVEILRYHIEQVQQIARDLSDIEMDDLLPEIHREVLTEQLQLHYEFLQGIRSGAAGDDALTKGSKLQWALIDKKKTSRIMEDVASIQQTLDQILNIVSVRLATVQQSSLAALRISNAALLPALEVHMQEIKATIVTASGRDVVRWEDNKTEIVRRKGDGAASSEYRHVQDTVLTRPGQRLGSRTAKYFSSTHRQSRASPQSVSDYSDVDDLLSLSDFGDFGTTTPARQSEWTFVGNQSKDTASANRDPRYEAQFSVKLGKYRRDFRASFKLRFFLLSERILRFELGLQQFTHAWTSVSLSDFRIQLTNVIPRNSLIFELCRQSDFEGVKRMLEDGRASICDVNDFGAGLLDYAIADFDSFEPCGEVSNKAKLQRYLIHRGCMPTANTSWRAEDGMVKYPAIFEALSTGQTDTVRLMLQSGFTFDLFDTHSRVPTKYICETNKSDFREQLSLLSSLGLMEKGAIHGRLLAQAVAVRSIPDIIYVRETLQVGWEDADWLLSQVVHEEHVNIASTIQEYGLTPKLVAETTGRSTHWWFPARACMAHWYLFTDKDRIAASSGFYESLSFSKRIRFIVPGSLWGAVLASFIYEVWRTSWHFQEIVTALQHLLLHKESPTLQFWDEVTDKSNLFKTVIITAQEIAQAWDRNLPLWRVDSDDDDAHKQSVWWTSDGKIFPFDETSGEGDWAGKDKESDDDQKAESEEPDKDGNLQAEKLNKDEEVNDEEGADSGKESDDAGGLKRNIPHAQPMPTLFESIIATREGRRRMLRYPMTTALYYAYHLAGFSVDMDDDGDIWYDDDDCDRYSDAVEDQEDCNRPGPLGGTCKICRDPEAYGLGHILEEAEEGLVEWRHERQKFVDRGALEPDGWDWPSWTRRGGWT